MYCPSCGAENQDGVKFCRLCRANLSLVKDALTGQLPQEPSTRRSRRRDRDHHRAPSFESGLRHTFSGIGFIAASIAVFFFAPAGKLWFWSFLFPAFTLLGKGISEILIAQKQQQNFPQQQHPVNRPVIAPPPASVNMRPRNTGEMVQPPPSVTESTTKLFDPPAEK